MDALQWVVTHVAAKIFPGELRFCFLKKTRSPAPLPKPLKCAGRLALLAGCGQDIACSTPQTAVRSPELRFCFPSGASVSVTSNASKSTNQNSGRIITCLELEIAFSSNVMFFANSSFQVKFSGLVGLAGLAGLAGWPGWLTWLAWLDAWPVVALAG